MNHRRITPTIGSFTLALAFCVGISTAACSSDSQSDAATPQQVGGASSRGGQASTSTAAGGATAQSNGGASAANPEGSGGSVKGGTSGSSGQSSVASGGATSASSKPSAGGTPAAGGKTGTGGNVAAGGKTGASGSEGVGGRLAGGGRASGGDSPVAGGVPAAGGRAGVAGAAPGASGRQGFAGRPGSSGSTSVGGSAPVAGSTGSVTPTDGYCPASEPCRISPLGDSITEGMGWTPPGASTWGGGYRIKLFSLATKDNKSFTFVGTRSNGPSTVDGKAFPQKHEGTSGISIEDLKKNVVDKGGLTRSDVKPHIILLHIGTNNLYGTHSDKPEVFMAQLLDKIIADCPDALLVVAKIIPYSGSDAFNAKLPALVDERAQKGAHIVLIDQSAGFDSKADIADGVHPNEGGYTKMANVWYKAISQYLH